VLRVYIEDVKGIRPQRRAEVSAASTKNQRPEHVISGERTLTTI